MLQAGGSHVRISLFATTLQTPARGKSCACKSVLLVHFQNLPPSRAPLAQGQLLLILRLVPQVFLPGSSEGMRTVTP